MVGYKNIFLSLQLTKLGNQFSDASNATSSNLSGVIGEIPEYQVIDFVLNYSFKKFKIETGINNMGNESILREEQLDTRAQDYSLPPETISDTSIPSLINH